MQYLANPLTTGRALMAAALCALLLATGASAQSPSGKAKRLAALDSDGDGQVTLDEFAANDAELFGRLDGDDDGVVTLAEFLDRSSRRGFRRHWNRGAHDHADGHPHHDHDANGNATRAERRAAMRAAHEEHARAAFADMDSDGDEVLTPDEVVLAAFARTDDNGDGVLSGDELVRGKRGGHGRDHAESQTED